MGSIIKRISVHLPENVLSNLDLANEFHRWNPEKIEKKIGIRERRIANLNETAGDLAYEAALSVLQGYDKEKIDSLIFCTQSPDYFLPATACLLQDRLALGNHVSAFDFNQGCSGYIYGLAMSKAFINSGIASNVLLLMGETYSKHIHPKDLANRTIFGDGASATIIEKSDSEHIMEFEFGTDGSGYKNLCVLNGAFRSRFDTAAKEMINESGDISTSNHLFMNGPDIFNFTIESVPKAVENCLIKNEITISDIDYVIFHQANLYMIEYLRKIIKIPKEKFYANLLDTGNTVSSTIPIALNDCIRNKIIQKGDKILLCGYGVGYSWGAVIIDI